jgi:hypothetical protein
MRRMTTTPPMTASTTTTMISQPARVPPPDTGPRRVRSRYRDPTGKRRSGKWEAPVGEHCRPRSGRAPVMRSAGRFRFAANATRDAVAATTATLVRASPGAARSRGPRTAAAARAERDLSRPADGRNRYGSQPAGVRRRRA